MVQGPIAGTFTVECLKSIRRILPGAVIVLSTWKHSDVTGLDYDVLIENDDPGSAMLDGKPANYIRQITSSLNGLKACTTKYAVKMRSDMEIRGIGFLDYFVRFNTLPFDVSYKILEERVVILPTHNPRRNFKQPFHVSDWFFFGLTKDLIDIFEIPCVETNCVSSAEQYIWLSFLSKHTPISMDKTNAVPSKKNIEQSERYFANNCIIASARKEGIGSLKYPGKGYVQIPCFSDAGYYTFTDYKRMLNRYSGTNLIVIPNPIEEIAYFSTYHLRIFTKAIIRKRFPRLFEKLRKFANS